MLTIQFQICLIVGRKYYDTFRSYYIEQNTEPMIQLIGGYVEEELDKYLEIVIGEV